MSRQNYSCGELTYWRTLKVSLAFQWFLLLGLALVSAVLPPTAHAQTFTVLHAFHGRADGSQPFGGVVLDGKGGLYGATYAGGKYGFGTIYTVDSAGDTTVLHQFAGHDGCSARGKLLLDRAGNLYGTTNQCGSGKLGTAFELQKSGKFTVLHAFGGWDVSAPVAGLIRDSAGNLYGTGSSGGNCCNGGVFKLNHRTGAETVLYDFGQPPDGAEPNAPIILDGQGNLYGTTTLGGLGGGFGYGTVFKLDSSGAETILYSFTGGSDGAYPAGGVIRDSSGNLYGSTISGGLNLNFGTLFKLDSSGVLTVLHTFGTLFNDGSYPYGGLIADAAGNLFGTTQFGGTFGNGTVFKLDTAGNLTILHSFTGGADGQAPFDTLAMDAAGNLYGTTTMGGAPECLCGVVFKIEP